MGELINSLINRRSVKNYNDKPVKREDIDKIIEAGLYAPSGRNLQSPIIIAVTNKEMRDKLSKLNASILGTTSDPFYNAPVVLIVLADKKVPTYIYDGSLVMQNLMLAAYDLGLSSCWIHRAKEMFETDEGKSIIKNLGLDPDSYEGIGNCILGYSDNIPKISSPRQKNRIFHID